METTLYEVRAYERADGTSLSTRALPHPAWSKRFLNACTLAAFHAALTDHPAVTKFVTNPSPGKWVGRWTTAPEDAGRVLQDVTAAMEAKEQPE